MPAAGRLGADFDHFAAAAREVFVVRRVTTTTATLLLKIGQIPNSKCAPLVPRRPKCQFSQGDSGKRAASASPKVKTIAQFHGLFAANTANEKISVSYGKKIVTRVCESGVCGGADSGLRVGNRESGRECRVVVVSLHFWLQIQSFKCGSPPI